MSGNPYTPQYKKSHPRIARFIKNRLGGKWTKENVQKAQSYFNKRRRHKNNPKRPTDADSAAPRQVIYGTARTGGTLTYAATSDDQQTYYAIITLSGHEIDGLDAIHFGEETVSFSSMTTLGNATGKYADYVFAKLNVGTDTQSAIAQAVTDTASLAHKWTANDKQLGCAHIYIRLKYKEDLFPQGIPEMTFTIRGMRVWDPRTGTFYHTNNAALCARNFLLDARYGFGGSLSIDNSNCSWAADICGEVMTEPVGSTTTPGIRYSIDGVLDSDDSPEDVREMMAQSMGGFIMEVGGYWKLQPGVWLPPTVSIDESDFIGEIHVQTRIPRRDSFNGVKGTFVAPQWDYEEGDFPPVSSSLYVNQDNHYEQWEDITLPLVTHPTTAQRLAKLFLERVRQPMTITARVHPRVIQLMPIENIQVSYSRLGFTNHNFEIKEMSHEFTETNGGMGHSVILTLKETGSPVYDWNNGDATLVDFAPETDLPPVEFSAPPTDLVLESGNGIYYIRQDGTIMARIRATFVPPVQTVVMGGGYYEAQWKRSTDSTWTDTTTIPGSASQFFILDVEDGLSYDVRLRTINAFGSPSTWLTATGHTVIGKTSPPSDVTGFTVTKEQSGNRLTWDPIPDIDLSEYEIRLGASWAAGVWFLDTRSTDFFWDVRSSGTYEFWIKALDTSGNYSLNATHAALTISDPSIPPSITYAIEGDTVVVKWAASTADYPIAEYEVWFGQTYATSVFLGTTKGTTWRKKGDWSSWNNFYILARDTAGNLSSSAGFVTVTLSNPNAPQNLTVKVVDNNVLLDWDAPTAGVLDIARYKVYRGATFGAATFLGSVDGTFAAYIETVGGNYTYWITAVDLAGHESSAVSIGAAVYNPPDYVLIANNSLNVTYGGVTAPYIITQSQVYPESATTFVAPANSIETYAQHFTNNSQTTFGGFTTAGYTYLLQPVPTGGTTRVEWKVDYGGVLPESVIQVSYTKADIAGTTTVTTNISYSSDDVTYTAGTAGSARVFAQNFRYAKIRLDIAATDNKGLTRISNITAKLDVKKQTDSGTASVLFNDTGGTTINFGLPFLDITSITVTPQGTAARTVTVDFTDAPNPTSFKVLLWDKDGVRQSGTVRWSAEGVVNVV